MKKQKQIYQIILEIEGVRGRIGDLSERLGGVILDYLKELVRDNYIEDKASIEIKLIKTKNENK